MIRNVTDEISKGIGSSERNSISTVPVCEESLFNNLVSKRKFAFYQKLRSEEIAKIYDSSYTPSLFISSASYILAPAATHHHLLDVCASSARQDPLAQEDRISYRKTRHCRKQRPVTLEARRLCY